jgi:hypothetical protein
VNNQGRFQDLTNDLQDDTAGVIPKNVQAERHVRNCDWGVCAGKKDCAGHSVPGGFSLRDEPYA